MTSWRIKARLEVRKIWAIICKDKYDHTAAELTNLLLQNWNKATKDAIRNVIRSIKGKEKFTNQQKDNMARNILAGRSANRLQIGDGWQSLG